MQHLDRVISDNAGENVELSQITFILSELHATDGSCKLVTAFPQGTKAAPRIPDILLLLHLSAVSLLLAIVTKGREWLGGTARRCPATDLLNFPTV